ncbi:MAG: universal stress protein [Thermodesulfobacteriota bacterium]
MPGSVLLAVDNSKNSQKAVDYVCANVGRDTVVTVFSVLPDVASACDMDDPSLVPIFKDNRKAFCSLEDAKKAAAKGFAENAKTCLTNAGFPAKNVKVKVVKKKGDVAGQIIAEAQKGGHDTIVMGRRGLSGIKEFFLGSVSNKVVQQAQGLAVLVVG